MVKGTLTHNDPALPMTYPGFVFRILRNEGHAADVLLSGTDLREEQLVDPLFRCGFAPLRRLFLNAIEQTGDPHLGIRLARKFEPTFIGLPAYAAMNAPRFVDALEVLGRYFQLAFPAVEFVFPHLGAGPRLGEAAVSLRPRFPFTGIEYFATASALVACDGLFRAILRTDKVALRAETAIRQPVGWSGVAEEVGFPVRFDAQHDVLFFPEAYLHKVLPAEDPINHARLVSLCEKFAAEVTFETTVVSRVLSRLEEEPDPGASLSAVATALGYSERGLRRHLARSGTSFRQLVEEIRQQRARKLLSDSKQPIKAIAGMLGYESSTNFTRSFKRWTGLTPKEFREQSVSMAEYALAKNEYPLAGGDPD